MFPYYSPISISMTDGQRNWSACMLEAIFTFDDYLMKYFSISPFYSMIKPDSPLILLLSHFIVSMCVL